MIPKSDVTLVAKILLAVFVLVAVFYGFLKIGGYGSGPYGQGPYGAAESSSDGPIGDPRDGPIGAPPERSGVTGTAPVGERPIGDISP